MKNKMTMRNHVWSSIYRSLLLPRRPPQARYCHCYDVCPFSWPSITLTYRDHMSFITSKVITRVLWLGFSLIGAPISVT